MWSALWYRWEPLLKSLPCIADWLLALGRGVAMLHRSFCIVCMLRCVTWLIKRETCCNANLSVLLCSAPSLPCYSFPAGAVPPPLGSALPYPVPSLPPS